MRFKKTFIKDQDMCQEGYEKNCLRYQQKNKAFQDNEIKCSTSLLQGFVLKRNLRFSQEDLLCTSSITLNF